MKNQKALTLAALAGITLGGLTMGTAAAQSADAVEDISRNQAPRIVQIQDTTVPGSDAGTDAQTETEVEEQRQGRRGHRGGCGLEAAAEAIGISEDDLKAAVEAGDTIADVATANGVAVDAVIDAMVAEKAEKIDGKVESGRITQAEADEKLAAAEAKITAKVNGTSTTDNA